MAGRGNFGRPGWYCALQNRRWQGEEKMTRFWRLIFIIRGMGELAGHERERDALEIVLQD